MALVRVKEILIM